MSKNKEQNDIKILWRNIEKKVKNKVFLSAIKYIEEYLGIPSVGIDEKLLLDYAKCLSRVGRRKDALKVLAIIKKYFLEFSISEYTTTKLENEEDLLDIHYNILNSPLYSENINQLLRRIASIYALCSNEDEVKAILDELEKKTSLDAKFYFGLAQNCNYNGLQSLALQLYDKCLKKVDAKTPKYIRQKSQNAIEQIKKYQQISTEFSVCTYGHFIAEGQDLAPGHIITAEHVCRKNNLWDPECAKHVKKPFMIWKIEGNFIYAFPLSTNLDREQYTFTQKRYPCQGRDRRLKDSVYLIEKKHIANVCGKISNDDYNAAIEAMYTCVCHTQKGKWEAGSEYFMEEMLKKRQAFVGNIIMTHDTKSQETHYYLVTKVDLELHEYETVEVDKRFKLLSSKKSTKMFSDDSKEIKAIFPVKDEDTCVALLKEYGIISEDGNLLRVVFTYKDRILEIMKATESHYMCMDITESKYPQNIKIISVPKTLPLNIITRISEKDFDIQWGKYNKKTKQVKNKIQNYPVRKTPLFTGKAKVRSLKPSN